MPFFVSEKTRTYYHAGGILKKVPASEERDIWYFRPVEVYVARNTEAKFSHSICPVYMQEHFPEGYESIKKRKAIDGGPGEEV